MSNLALLVAVFFLAHLVERSWAERSRAAMANFQTLCSGSRSLNAVGHLSADASVTLLFLVLVAMSWRLKRISWAIFATLLFLPMVSTGTAFSSVSRYGLELFPAFIVLGRLTARRAFFAFYLAAASAASLALMVLFALGWWVA